MASTLLKRYMKYMTLMTGVQQNVGGIYNVEHENYQSRADEYYKFYSELANEEYDVEDIQPLDLTEIRGLSRTDNFSPFIEKHQQLAGKLVDIFMESTDLTILLKRGIFARERVNPYLFNYAWSICLLHHSETRDIKVPSLITSFPDKLLPHPVLTRAREETEVSPPEIREIIEIPREYTASRAQPEHRLAYFREDLGVNLHHWHWHLVYPGYGHTSFVKKNRRGELFYYMHRQMVARYNFERLCNKLKRVDRFIDFRKPITHGYFSKLNSSVASREWPGRVEYQELQNMNRKEGRYDLNDLERYRDRIYNAIHLGYYIGLEGEHINFTVETGIDVLSNMVEASKLSPNLYFYGDVHNKGHVLISASHDPEYKHLEELGVMGDTATAMRDPVFYQWHAFIDDLFQEYKKTLPAYSSNQLEYIGICVEDISIGKDNILNTRWVKSDVDINHGLDFAPRGPTQIRFTHLDHTAFEYNITVMNSTKECYGTCRIFISPKYDESGHDWLFDDQRLMMVELDRFVVQLSTGKNVIKRKSSASSVTIPFDVIFASLEESNVDPGTIFCSCGWPEYMLIPKGTEKGFPCELFVMISNYEDDKVQQIRGFCKEDASSFCGVKDGKYPDKRPMGFPFDRPTSIIEGTLKQFLSENMCVKDIIIQLLDDEYTHDKQKDEEN